MSGSGLSDKREAAILDSEFSGTTYLRLLTGTSPAQPNDDGTLPAGCAEVSTGGYAPISIPAASWNAAIGGAPTVKTLPTAAASPISITPSGVSWQLCGYAFTSNNSAISSTNYLYGGLFSDINSVPITYNVLAGEAFQITNAKPIVLRLGDPPVGVNPT